jgi:hypothetical protein
VAHYLVGERTLDTPAILGTPGLAEGAEVGFLSHRASPWGLSYADHGLCRDSVGATALPILTRPRRCFMGADRVRLPPQRSRHLRDGCTIGTVKARRTGAFRTGRYTAEARAERPQVLMLIRDLRRLIDSSE